MCAKGWCALWSAEGKKKGQREKAGIGEKGVLVPWSGVCGSVLMARKQMQGSSGRLKGEGRASLGGGSFFQRRVCSRLTKKGWV